MLQLGAHIFHDKISRAVSNFPVGKQVYLQLVKLSESYRGGEGKKKFLADANLKHKKRVEAMIARGMRWAAPTCI